MSQSKSTAEIDGTGDEIVRVDLYEKWRRIYPAWVSGGWQAHRRRMLVALLLIFYGSPWLRWDGAPGVRFDLAQRRFTLFWQTFVPDDFILLAWTLATLALLLFVATIAAGRLFCGWLCPQTMWTLVYFTLERFIEGDRFERMKRDRGPWSREKVAKKAIKYGAWGLVAFSISITFVGYFTEIRALVPRVLAFELTGWETVFVLLPAAGSYFFSGVLREQVCFHMCPYARFQSVMLDRDSLIIGYDATRGEPRARGRRAEGGDPDGNGACIDCERCVKVCPTGIDIRDGLQYQCIGCAACIDACTEIMDKTGGGASLVRYSSENRDAGVPGRVFRPRLIGYSTLATLLVALLVGTAASRLPLDVDVMRDRNRLYRTFWDGRVENVYSLRISNRDGEARSFAISVESAAALEFRGERMVEIPGGEMRIVPISLFSAAAAAPDAGLVSEVEFTVRRTNGEGDGPEAHAVSTFHRPAPRTGPSDEEISG